MENKEITIKLSDILASFVKSACLIVALTILFTGLGGAFGIYRARRATVSTSLTDTIDSLNKDIAVKQAEIEKLKKTNETLTTVNIPYTETRVKHEQDLSDSRREYQNNSLYNQIDSFNCGTSRITIGFDIPIPPEAGEDYSNYRNSELMRMVNACTMMSPVPNDMLKDMAKAMGLKDLDEKYIGELVSITNKNNQFVELCVVHPDPDVAKKGCEFLYTKVLEELAELNPDCQVTKVGSFTGVEVNWAMYQKKTSYEDNTALAEKNLITDQATLNQLNTTVADNQILITAAEAEVKKMQADLSAAQSKQNHAQQNKSWKRSALKFGILGFAGGLVLACVLVFVKDFLGGKVRNRNGVSTRYDVPVLGVLPGKKKRLFEKTIRRLEGDSLYEDKDIVSSVAANVQAVTANESGKVCLIGTVDEKDPALSDLLKALKGKIEFKGNLLSGAQGIKNLESYDQVILVEKRNESRFSAISDEITRIRSLQKNVMGMILL